MNKGILAVGIILLSVIALLLINVLTNFSTGSELDYYLLKETSDAAMSDALDYGYLRNCGLYRIDKEKFVENFLYRFASSVDNTREYRIGFYDINEVPPKVSIKIDSLTVLAVNSIGKTKDGKKEAVDISTSYDAILESTGVYNPVIANEIADPNSDQCRAYVNTYNNKTKKELPKKKK